jgi:hypothetical protein
MMIRGFWKKVGLAGHTRRSTSAFEKVTVPRLKSVIVHREMDRNIQKKGNAFC